MSETAIYIRPISKIYARRVKYEGLPMSRVPEELREQVEYAIEEGLV